MAIVGIVLFALLLLAVPIGIALSAAAAAYIFVDPLLEPNVIFRQFFSQKRDYANASAGLRWRGGRTWSIGTDLGYSRTKRQDEADFHTGWHAAFGVTWSPVPFSLSR